MKRNNLLLLLMGAAILCQTHSLWAATTFRFTLPRGGRTSAGVYTSNGTLIRTLWKKRPLSGGAHSAQWDNKDESGAVMPAGNYQIKLIHHNVNYEWEGVIGNTSSMFTGNTVHRGARPAGMAITGSKAFLALGYNEGQALARSFNTSNPQSLLPYASPRTTDRGDQAREFTSVATDGTNVYYANSGTGWSATYNSFVVASKVSDNSEVIFPNGVIEQAVADNGSTTWNSVIDKESGADRDAGKLRRCTSLSVQSSGSLLAVAHLELNQVRLFNKTSGALIRTIAVTRPGPLAFAPNGDLWMICTNGSGVRVACRYTNMTATGTPSLSTTITGLSDPRAIAVDPRSTSNVVKIADAGTSHQVKSYNSTNGSLLSTLGTAGGYATGPTVTNTKFWFREDTLDSTPGAVATFIAFAPDGSFWVEDKGNRRMLHFSDANVYIEQVAYFQTSRMTTVDPNNPTRVFSNFLEYQIDYSKPLAPNNGSWTLVRNWGWGNPKAAVDTFGFHTVVTLGTRTFARLGSPWENFGSKLYELTGTIMRDTGITFEDYYGDGVSLEADGSRQFQRQANGRVTFYRTPYAGLNGSNNPTWGAEVALGSAPASNENDPYYKMNSFSARTKVTSTGVVVSFDPSNSNTNTTGWHLGGVAPSGNDWQWKASRVGWTDGLGSFQNHAIDDYINSPGNVSDVIGRNIIYGFHGEFWRHKETGSVGQANQTMHFYDNGLFVGQFGQPNYFDNAGNSGNNAPLAGASGNALTWSVVRANNEVYLYHCDESSHSGIHRWRLAGINDILEIVGSGPLDSTIQMTTPSQTPPTSIFGEGLGLTAQFFDSKNFTNEVLNRIDPEINFDWSYGVVVDFVDPAKNDLWDNFTARWSGEIQAVESGTYTFKLTGDDRMRLYIGTTLVVDTSSAPASERPATRTGTFTMTAKQKYPVRIDFEEDNGFTNARFDWQRPGQLSFTLVPQSQLYPVALPDDLPDTSGGPATGNGTGLKGDYYSGQNFNTFVQTRTDAKVDFDWGTSTAMASVGPDDFSIRWSGQVQAMESGTYTFTTQTDDGVRLWVNGQLLIDKWVGQPATVWSNTIALTAGQKYNIKMEYFEGAGGAMAHLLWRRPGQTSDVVIPQSQLYPTTNTGPTPYVSGIPIGQVVSLKSLANGLFVSAADSSTSLIANKTTAGINEQFMVVDGGNNYIGLRSLMPGNYYVTAENAGSSPLIANRPSVGSWEVFQWLDQGTGQIALRAGANNNIVCADAQGSSPLIANRTAVGGEWEKFSAFIH